MRLSTSRAAVASLVFISACGGAASTPPRPPPPAATAASTPAPVAKQATAPERLAADSPRATPGGATFTAPAGWTLSTSDREVLLAAPDPDLRVALVDVKAASADAAVAAAWAAYRAGWNRPLKVSQPATARQGWDERRTYEYETSPNEKLVVYAIALRHGDAWTVALVDGAEASFERRGAQVGLLLSSLRPQGYQRESFAGKAAHHLDADRIKQLTDFLQQGMKDGEVPGVGLALVQDDRIVYAGGLGVREVGKPAPVTADTLFMIASNTKGLTTLMLAKLVDEKRFAWDTHVTDVYPPFELGDADTTRQVEIRHLVCACTGLPRQDMEWLLEFDQSSPKSIMGLLGTMQPTSKFGEVYQYSNVLAAAAGYVGGHAAYPDKELGAAYDEAMKTRVFGPLGMTKTTLDFDRALAAEHATPYGEDADGKTAPAKMELNRSSVPIRPAGGAWSSANDLVKYVRMELANGKLADGSRYVSQENLLARRTKQVQSGEDLVYGMGLETDTRWGVPIVRHGGALFGFHSDMFWLPEQNVGGVILTSAETGYPLRAAFLRRFVEVLFDGRPEAAEDLANVLARRKQESAAERARLGVPPDAAAVAQLAARYRSPALGTIAVRKSGAGVVFDFGEWSSAVASRKNDDGTWSFVTTDASVAGLAFVVGKQGDERTLVLRDAQHEYVLIEAR